MVLFSKKKRRLVRLLIVEDEPLVAFDAEHLLSDDGFVVVATVDGAEDAIELIQSGAAIDLVLSDVSLASGNGVDVAHAARAAGVPLLFVSGQSPIDAPTIADGCLAKPYAQRDLLLAIAALEAVLAGDQPRRLPSGFTLFRTIAKAGE